MTVRNTCGCWIKYIAIQYRSGDIKVGLSFAWSSWSGAHTTGTADVSLGLL